MIELPPGWIIIAGAFLIPLLRGYLRQAALVALPVLAMVMIWTFPSR